MHTSPGLPGSVRRQLFFLVSGRDPDAAGFAFWGGNGAGSLAQVADDFTRSPGAFTSDYVVIAAYQVATGAPPAFAQFITAVASIRAGAQRSLACSVRFIGGGKAT